MQNNQESSMNNSGMYASQENMPANPQVSQQMTPQFVKTTPYSQPEINDFMHYRMVYPDVYYKIQPFVMLACDQLDTYSSDMPTQEMVEKMSDNIYNDAITMYPDMAGYVKNNETDANADIPTQGPFDYGRDYGYRFRRRGLFRDFIDILLLSELFRRRRRFY